MKLEWVSTYFTRSGCARIADHGFLVEVLGFQPFRKHSDTNIGREAMRPYSNRPNLIGGQAGTVLMFSGKLQGGSDERADGAMDCARGIHAVRDFDFIALIA